MPSGSRKVPPAAPMRLNAAATPVPLARSCDGNSSAGYTPHKMPPPASKKEKNPQQMTTMIPGAADQPPISPRVIIIYPEARDQHPPPPGPVDDKRADQRPERRDAVGRDGADALVGDVQRGEHQRGEREDREVGRDH